MKKLVCDRCGIEITEKVDVDLALEGKRAWQEAAKLRGIEPRGVIPCVNYIRCHGEMKVVRYSMVIQALQRMKRADEHEEDS